MPSFIRFWNHWDHQFWMWKRAFEVYSTTDISKTVRQVANVFPSIQSFYKWLSAEEIWKARTAYLLRKWICKMLYVAHFGFSFKFLGGQKMTFPFLDFSRLFVCPLYALGEPNNTEKESVAICSHFFLDWLVYNIYDIHKSAALRYAHLCIVTRLISDVHFHITGPKLTFNS